MIVVVLVVIQTTMGWFSNINIWQYAWSRQQQWWQTCSRDNNVAWATSLATMAVVIALVIVVLAVWNVDKVVEAVTTMQGQSAYQLMGVSAKKI